MNYFKGRITLLNGVFKQRNITFLYLKNHYIWFKIFDHSSCNQLWNKRYTSSYENEKEYRHWDIQFSSTDCAVLRSRCLSPEQMFHAIATLSWHFVQPVELQSLEPHPAHVQGQGEEEDSRQEWVRARVTRQGCILRRFRSRAVDWVHPHQTWHRQEGPSWRHRPQLGWPLPHLIV